MDRETVLQKSRESSKGEGFETYAETMASRISRYVGVFVCGILIVLGGFVFDVPELAFGTITVFSAMASSHYIVQYVLQRKRSALVEGILNGALLVFAVVFLFLHLLGVR